MLKARTKFFHNVSIISHTTTKKDLRLKWLKKYFSTSHHESVKDINSDNIVLSKFPNIEPYTNVTIPEFMWETFSKAPWRSKPAFKCGTSGVEISHESVYKNSKAFGAALLNAGMKRGDTVGIVLPNNIHYVSILFGILDAGLIASPVNPAYHPDEMMRQIKDSNSKTIVTVPTFVPSIQKLRSSAPELKDIIIVGEAQEGCHTYSEMIKTDYSSAKFLKGSEIDATNEIALLPYSSGTTGMPKGVCLTHSNITTQLRQVLLPGCLQIENDIERTVAVIPFFHSYGLLTFMFIGPYRGATNVCLPRFDPALFLKNIREHKPTILHLVTPLIAHIVNSPDYGPKEFENVHTIVAGAAPLGRYLIEKILEKAQKYIFFQEVYGMTEMSPGTHVLSSASKNKVIGSCGQLISTTTAKIISTDGSDKILGVRESGEICLKGPQMMKGYWNNEKATKETIDSEGWLRTGDIGYYDENGYFFIVDRLKELIKVKGFQVAPAELEGILCQHPSVADAAVIGIPNEELGEVPRGYIVAKKDNKVTEEELLKFVKERVTSYKQLKGGIEFTDAIPKAPSGKILRRVLKLSYCEKNNIKI